MEPSRENFFDVIEIAEESALGLNDAVAYVLMRTTGIEEIYSFDRQFDQLPDSTRISR